MTLPDLIESAVTALAATHYNPHWLAVMGKWMAVQLGVALIALRNSRM